MAKDDSKNNQTPESQGQENRNVSVLTQYVKDISFESPNSPQSLQASQERPNINISVDVVANKLQESQYEVILKISASAKRGEETAFLAEVSYGGIFAFEGVPEAELQPALLIFCPALLFPYVRRVISDLTRDGGFPSLMLDPVDFAQLYQQRMQKMQAEQQAKAEAQQES